jgi:hypothetical protein
MNADQIRNAVVGMAEALQKIDNIMQVMFEGGFGNERNLNKNREIVSLAQTWLQHADAIRALQSQPAAQAAGQAHVWDYCPECGGTESDEPRNGMGHFCLKCGQEWHAHIDYSEVVRRKLERLSANKPIAAAAGQAGEAEQPTGEAAGCACEKPAPGCGDDGNGLACETSAPQGLAMADADLALLAMCVDVLRERDCGPLASEIQRLLGRVQLSQPRKGIADSAWVGEVVIFGRECKEVSWRKGKMPEPGTQLYAAPPSPTEELTDGRIIEVATELGNGRTSTGAFLFRSSTLCKFVRALLSAQGGKG